MKKKVLITYEIEPCETYADEAFIKRDIMQELSCCVNAPEEPYTIEVSDVEETIK